MKEENTNLELNQTTTPAVDTPNPVGTTEDVVNASAPVEMPAPVDASTSTEMPAPVPTVTPVDMSTPVESTTEPVSEAPVEMPAPVQSEVPSQDTNLASPDLGVATMSNLEPVNGTQDTAGAPVVDGPSATEIAAGIENGSMVNAVSDPNAMIGAKVGNSADDSGAINKNKGKKNFTILIVILVILAILGGVGYFVYDYEYKSSNKRVDALFSQLNNFVLPLITDVEKRMGDYDLTASVTQGKDNKAEVHLSGNYAYNLEDYIYFDTKIDKIYYNQDLLDKTPISANLYISDDNLYIKSEELFSKYIMIEETGLKSIMDNIKQNDIDYALYYNSVMNALKVSIKNYAVSQTVGKTNITGKSQQANIVTISLNKNNYKGFVQSFTNNLSSNDAFVSDIAKLTGESKEDIIKTIKQAGETDYDFDGSLTVNFYSPLFGNKILGIDATIIDGDDTYKTSFVPVGDDWKVTAYENNDKVTEFTLGLKLTQSNGKKSYVTTFKGEYSYENYDEEKEVIQADITFAYNINVQFQDDKPVTRDAVKVESLTEEDIKNIYTNLTTKYGLLGTYLSDYVEDLFDTDSDDEDEDDDYSSIYTSTTRDAYCSQSYSCNCSGSTCECKYYDEDGDEQSITCPNSQSTY